MGRREAGEEGGDRDEEGGGRTETGGVGIK